MSDFAKLRKRIAELEQQIASSVTLKARGGVFAWEACHGHHCAIGTTKADALRRLARHLDRIALAALAQCARSE